MTSRVALLVVATCVVAAGCTGAPTGGSPTTDAPTTTVTEDGGPCATTTDYDPQPTPDLPENATGDTAASFAVAYEEALAWNDMYATVETDLYASGRANAVEQVGDGYVVHVTGGATYKTCDGGDAVVGDGFLHATYFVNETAAVRLDNPENETADPRANGGKVVERA